MADMFIGEIRILPYSFAPEGWAFCDGRTMSVHQSQTLYSIIGIIYGGDAAQQTFLLPNLQCLVPIGAGTGPGLTPRALGKVYGSNSVSLTAANVPTHNHTLNFQVQAAPFSQMTAGPTANVSYASHQIKNATTPLAPLNFYAPTAGAPSPANTTLAPQCIGPTGGSNAHENRQPYLPLNFCIALDGAYPARSD